MLASAAAPFRSKDCACLRFRLNRIFTSSAGSPSCPPRERNLLSRRATQPNELERCHNQQQQQTTTGAPVRNGRQSRGFSKRLCRLVHALVGNLLQAFPHHSVSAWHNAKQNDTTRHDTTRHDTTRHDTTRHDTKPNETKRQAVCVAVHTMHGVKRLDTAHAPVVHYMPHDVIQFLLGCVGVDLAFLQRSNHSHDIQAHDPLTTTKTNDRTNHNTTTTTPTTAPRS